MTSRATWPDLWILRHGETAWNAEGRLQGRLDSPLTPLGEAQARAQGVLLQRAGLPRNVRVRVSPAGRARRTADLALKGAAWPVTVDPDLVEVGLGAWQGRTRSEILQAHPDIDLSRDPYLWKFDGPGCETLDEIVARAHRALTRLEGPTILITHGIMSRVLRCVVLGLPPQNLSHLPGGQGVIHHISEGRAQCLALDPKQTGDNQPHDGKGCDRT